MKRSSKPESQAALFPDAVASPSPLSLVETPNNQKLGDQTTKVADFEAHKKGIGRPNDQRRPKWTKERDQSYASRSLKRKGGRLNPKLVTDVEVELAKQGLGAKGWSKFVNRAMEVYLEAGAPQLGVWSPTCSSCSCSIEKTTTTTVVAQSLPGFPPDVLEMPHKTRHSAEMLWAFAWSSYQGEIEGFSGVDKPEAWFRAAWAKGHMDSLVDRWLIAKRQIEETRERRRLERERILDQQAKQD